MRFSRTPLIAALLGVAAAGTVHADDVPHQQVPQLVKDGTIQSLETLDKGAMDTGKRIRSLHLSGGAP